MNNNKNGLAANLLAGLLALVATAGMAQSDADGDGINDDTDNCPQLANTDQADRDNDGIGDVCDPQDDTDTDGDGIRDDADNCALTANPDQADQDGDGLGDACENDTDGDGLADASDVLIDFSVPQALDANLHAAIGAGIPIVIGTTGLDTSHHDAIDNAARVVAVLQTGNTSLGVTMLAKLVREAAGKLDAGWDIEIVEMHHRRKVDAPSGTALLLGEAAAQGRGIDLAENSERGRDGHTGERGDGAIGFASLRGGTVAGEHSVILAGENERIVLSHVAEDRALFARGALTGAAGRIGKQPGRYTMEDVLGI